MPPSIAKEIGCAMWRRKAGKNLAEAKRNAAVFLAETEQLIQQARGQQLTPEQKLVSLIPHVADVPEVMDAHDLVQEVSQSHALGRQGNRSRYEELQGLAQDVLRGTARPPKPRATDPSLLKSPHQPQRSVAIPDQAGGHSGREYPAGHKKTHWHGGW